MKEEIKQNLRNIKERIFSTCFKVNRPSSSVRLIGVSKTVPSEHIKAAFQEGLDNIGENYIQEARQKKSLLMDLPITWHFIGHLQTNKAKLAVEIFDWIHTVDRPELAEKLNKVSIAMRQSPLPVLVQLNLAQEKTKGGLPPEMLPSFYKYLEQLDGLSVRGLMILPPFCENPETTRPYFREARNLLRKMQDLSRNPHLVTELSMGMSHDFEIAIEEGATMVRIGTALFGERPCRI